MPKVHSLTTVAEALTEVGPRLTRERLEDVAGPVDQEKGKLLAQFVYGSISWSAELGRPGTASLAAGFSITHEYWREEIIAVPNGGGFVVHRGYESASEVSSWDSPTVDGKHHVGFLAQFTSKLPPEAANRFTVDLSRVAWRDDAPFSGVRGLRPRSAVVARPSRIVFLEFEVVQIPYLEIERAGVLTDG